MNGCILDVGAKFPVIEAQMWTISPWWTSSSGRELAKHAPAIRPGRTPITYPSIWEREREEQLGYAYRPRFLANTVTFDARNHPVMRVGVHGVLGSHSTVYHMSWPVQDVYIQRLSDEGVWMSLSVTELLRGAIPDWNDDVIASGVDQPEERVAFDLLGHAYTVVITGNHGHLLLQSRDDMHSWDVYQLARDVSVYRIETTPSDRPPVLFRWKRLDHPENDECQNGRISIIAPNRNTDGTLTNLDPIEIQASFATDGPSHSGVADMTVTRNNRTHVVYPGTNVVVGHDGTPHWAPRMTKRRKACRNACCSEARWEP